MLRSRSHPYRLQAVLLETFESRHLFASVGVTVDLSTAYQTIDGFGTAQYGTTFGFYETDAYQQMYFSDLGASMLRIALPFEALTAAPNDYATPVVLGDDLQANIDKFDFAYPKLASFGAVAAASKTKALANGGGFKLFASMWTPPHWMKGEEVDPQTGQPNGTQPQVVLGSTGWWSSAGGSLIDTPANLEQYGRYVAAYVKGFEQSFGVALDAISIQNELAFHEPYSSCVYSPSLYVKALKAVGAAFEHYGITTKLMGPEDVGVGSTSSPQVLQRQMSYINAIRNDPEANALLGGYVIHGYAYDGVSTNRSPAQWANYWSQIKADGKHSWETETSGEAQTWAGGLLLAQNVQDALTQGNVSAWFYYLAARSATSTSAEALTVGTDTTTPKYVAAKHFFRYVRPGAQRVEAVSSDTAGVYVSAFSRAADQTLTTVMINASTQQQDVTLSVVGGKTVNHYNVAYLSTSGALWQAITPTFTIDGMAKLTLPAGSMLTLQGVQVAAPPVSTVTLQAEAAALSGGTVKATNHTGYTGTGFADYSGNGSAVQWTLNWSAAGQAKLDFRYANGGTANRPLTVSVNGVSVGTIACVPTGNWDTWKTVSLTVALKAGSNTIKAVAGAAGGGNVDALTVTSTTITPPTGDTGVISGYAFNDSDKDGVLDTNESKAAGKTIYLDTNNNGKLDAGEKTLVTDTAGNFSFTGLGVGTYHIRRAFPTGYASSTPPRDFTLTAGQVISGVAIGSKTL